MPDKGRVILFKKQNKQANKKGFPVIPQKNFNCGSFLRGIFSLS